MKETFDQRDKREQREQRARTKRELLATREKRVKSLADLKRNAIFLSLWFLGCLLSTLWLYPRVPDSLWPLRFLSLVTIIGTLLGLVFTYEDFSDWKSAKRVVEYIEAEPLRQKEYEREYKEANKETSEARKKKAAAEKRKAARDKKKLKGGQK